MVDKEKEMDVIAKAHLAAERLERANQVNEELCKRMEASESRMLLGGLTAAGGQAPLELTEEEKLHQSLKTKWKDTALDGLFK